MIETHSSWVALAGDRAYKIKKPVKLPFLDYSTPEVRRHMCEEEVRVNRELAPDVYLGVRGVTIDPAGEMVFGPAEDPAAIDYAIEMRRLDLDRSLAALVSAHRAGTDEIRTVARLVAAYHARARRVPAGFAADLRRRLDENAETILRLLPDQQDVALAIAVERALAAQAHRFRNALDRRAANGSVRDVHGDLRAEHVVLEDPPLIFDRIEFDPSLRQIDVGCDLAFLVMDLHDLGAPELADALASEYRAAGGDAGPDALLFFFAAYRAAVRAKVALLGPGGPTQCRSRLALARRFAWRARDPHVVVVCGPSAAGKSHLATAVSEASGLPRVSSDVTRKRLAGLAPTERGDEDLYKPDKTFETYRELGRIAAFELIRSGGVVIDATFRTEEDREAFRCGLGRPMPRVLYVECRAAPDVLTRRSRERLRDPARESDAGPALALIQAATFEPLDEVPAADHIVLRTERPVAELVLEIEEVLDERARPA